MKILVTGGAGFIGTHLCRALVRAGHSVRVLDIKSPKNRVPKVKYVRGDVRIEKDVKRALLGVGAVYHLAAIASIPLCEQEPLESTQTNLASTALILENLKPSTRFIFSSTSAVYGNSGKKNKSHKEDARLPKFESFYAAQKYGSEMLIRRFHESHGIPAVVFRFFNVYGPGQDPKSSYTGVITAFSEAIRRGQPLRLNGGGLQTRDFVSVHDVVRGLVLALRCPEKMCNGDPMNLGTGRAITIRELAETMIRVRGASVAMNKAPWRAGDVMHSCANIGRAGRVLKWKPEVSLAQGLSLT